MSGAGPGARVHRTRGPRGPLPGLRIALVVWVLSMFFLSCMRARRDVALTAPQVAPRADAATLGLWRMDEVGGFQAVDSGPLRLDLTAGRDVGSDFGRFRGARHFTRSIESFLYAPYRPEFESPDSITIEAWIHPERLGLYEDTPIACRWTDLAGEQSWLFGLIGQNVLAQGVSGPGSHSELVALGSQGQLLFAVQREDASLPLAFHSTAEIELGRWTHVAVSYDGEMVRFYLNGRLDSQHAAGGRIRPGHAPLVVGNYLDPRWLTDFGGTLRVENVLDRTPFYAFEGLIDELRLSRMARREFPGVSER